MFIYLGQLWWGDIVRDETAVVILPGGPIYAGDEIWLLSQHTDDDAWGNRPLMTQKVRVPKVTRTAAGDDTFSNDDHEVHWEMTFKDNYQVLTVDLSNSQGGSVVDYWRVWKPESELSTGAGRIWIGKIDWFTFATDEICMFFVPEGFGEGNPAVSVWQWTRDAGMKNPNFIAGTQKMLSNDDCGVKFSYESWDDYHLTCTWDKASEDLSVYMKGPEDNRDLGKFKLVTVMNSELTQLRKEIEELKEELTVEEAEKAELTTRFDEAKASYEAEIKERDEEIKNSKQHDSQDHDTISRLSAQLEKERASKAEVQKKLDEKSAALAEVQARLKIQTEKVATLKRQLDELEKQMKELKTQLQTQTDKVATLEGQVKAEEKQVKELQVQNKEQADKISELEKELVNPKLVFPKFEYMCYLGTFFHSSKGPIYLVSNGGRDPNVVAG